MKITHNDIVLKLNNNDLLKKILLNYIKPGIYKYPGLVNIKIGDKNPFDNSRIWTEQDNLKYVEDLKYINELHEKIEINKTFEKPIKQNYGSTIYFLDCFINVKKIIGKNYLVSTLSNNFDVLIEVKTETEMKDFGEVLRQIKKYQYILKQTHIRQDLTILITPKILPDIKNLFEQEGIRVYEINDEFENDEFENDKEEIW
jgi:hypothetical protein